jgi:hypothetical protein
VSDEILRKDIKGERECISGGTNPSALLNVNPQAGIEEAINPEVYNRGIVRVCASRNPGSSTDPTRFVEVGYCGDISIRCWTDTKSVDNALSSNLALNQGAKNRTLSELRKGQLEELEKSGEILPEGEINRVIEGLADEIGTKKKPDDKNFATFITLIDNTLIKTILSYQRANLFLLKGEVYYEVAKKLRGKIEVKAPKEKAAEVSSDTGASLPPTTTGRILKLEESYTPAKTIYWTVNGKRTDPEVYVEGREIKIERFSVFLRDIPIGNIVEGDKINLLTPRKKNIEDILGVGSFDKINGIVISKLWDGGIELSGGAEVVGTLGFEDAETLGVETRRVLKLEKEYNRNEIIYWTMNKKIMDGMDRFPFFIEKSVIRLGLYSDTVRNVGTIINDVKIKLDEYNEDYFEQLMGVGSFTIINGKDVNDEIVLDRYRPLKDADGNLLNDKFIQSVGKECRDDGANCYSECFNNKAYISNCERGECIPYGYDRYVSPLSPGATGVCEDIFYKGENRAIISTPSYAIDDYCSDHSALLYDPYGGSATYTFVDVSKGIFKDISFSPVGTVLPVRSFDEFIVQLSLLKQKCNENNLNQLIVKAHGSPGSVYFGGTWGGAANYRICDSNKNRLKDATPFQTIKGSIVFASCNINAKEKGKDFAQCMADSLNADIYVAPCYVKVCPDGDCYLEDGSETWDKFSPSNS